MTKNSKQVFFRILSVFLVTLSGHSTLDSAQASSKRIIYLQAAQPTQSPAPQSTASPAAQPIASPSIQTNQSIEWIKQHPSACVLTIGILLYLGVLGLRPRWLLLLPLDKIPKTPVNPEIPIPPAIGSFLKYRPRVLDDWVNQRIAQAQEEFYQRRTVGERSIHIPIPVELSGNKPAIADFSINDLKAVFSKRNTRLLIVGEGGVGKTSLACQIAKWAMAENKAERLCKHRMLPVLIEEELEAIEGKSPLLEAIARQIKNLRDDEKPVSEELLKQLLEKRRILVIVDHLSEMSEATRKAARLKDSSSPVNALIVTSRLEDVLGKEVTHTTLKPQRVSGKQLSIFMDAYLTQQGKRDLFDDSEYFDALRRLSQIVTDERDVTVLFAKLYAAQMIAIAEGLVAEDLPNNVPDLMLSYINEVNREKDGKLDDDIVQRDLKAIAWECLKQTFKPETAEREQVINCLAALEGEGEAAKESAKKRLKYLEERLALIRTVPPAKTKIRFALDPLAEYLAGLHLVELYGEDEQKWQTFLDEATNKSGTLEEIRGFLLAVRDCCIAKPTEAKIPNSAIKKLGELSGLDLEALEQEQIKRRIRDLVSDLSRTDARDRVHAAQQLGDVGSDAEAAIPALIKALKDSDQDVREQAAETLGKIGVATQAVISELIDNFQSIQNAPSVQWACLKALRKFGTAAKSASPHLINALEVTQDRGTLRHLAATLGRINPESAIQNSNFNKVVDSLIKRLYLDFEKSSFWMGHHSEALGEIGPAASKAVPNLIKLLQNFISIKNSDYSCTKVVEALGEMGSTAIDAVPYLVQLLEANSTALGLESATALGKIGSRSPEVITALEKACVDGDYFVQKAAKEALKQILSKEE